MTVGRWLDRREPAPPPALARRVGELAAAGAQGDAPPGEGCLAAGVEGLGRLVSEADMGRRAALDLLAIDALVTYAFEAAADDPASIPTRAREAMTRLSRVIGP